MSVKVPQPFLLAEIDDLINAPDKIASNPYKLFSSYALNSILELVEDDGDEDEGEERKDYWNAIVPKFILENLFHSLIEDFSDAIGQHKPIQIRNRQYSVRKTGQIDLSLLSNAFNFPTNENGDYILTPEGVLNVEWQVQDVETYDSIKEDAKNNRQYLYQVIKLAEDIENGWDKLTDMEVVMYCWALFYQSTASENFQLFSQQYSQYLYVTQSDIWDCLTDKSLLAEKPIGLCPFAATKICDWNHAHRQISKAADIPIKDAEDYWYEKALKTNFKATV